VKPKADVTAEKNVKRLLQDSWLSNFAWLVYEPKIWWPNSNFSGQRKEKLVAKIHGKKVKTNISRSFARVIFVHVRPFMLLVLTVDFKVFFKVLQSFN
jgi:hypothetical protein